MLAKWDKIYATVPHTDALGADTKDGAIGQSYNHIQSRGLSAAIDNDL